MGTESLPLDPTTISGFATTPPSSAKFEIKYNLSQATYNIFSEVNSPLHVISDIFPLAASASLFFIRYSQSQCSYFGALCSDPVSY
jgi:hypothetical protein